MTIKQIDSTILKSIYKPDPKTHKGQNGRLLIIAGSKKYHGSLVLAASMASKIVDLFYIHTTRNNFEIIKKLRNNLAEFIYINKSDLKNVLKTEADAILIGPGLIPNFRTKWLVHKILKKYPNTKTLLDAGALRTVNAKLLHKNCVITPHIQEFEHLFGVKPTIENLKKISKNSPATIVLKGKDDYVCQNGICFKNSTGNTGMTKGGTGDVLAGLLAGILTKNDILTATKIAIYTCGLAGDKLKEKVNTYYSASEVIKEVQKILGKIQN